MSKNTPTVISSQIGIDKNDLIAIKVAKVERDLIQAQADQESTLRDLKQDHKKATDQLQAKLDKFAKIGDFSNITALGFFVDQEACLDNKGTKINVITKIMSDLNCYGHVSKSAVYDVSDDIASTNAKVKDISEKIDEVQTKLIEIRKRLGQIASIERQARAAMAVAVLEGSEEGRELMASLDTIKGLPEV